MAVMVVVCGGWRQSELALRKMHKCKLGVLDILSICNFTRLTHPATCIIIFRCIYVLLSPSIDGDLTAQTVLVRSFSTKNEKCQK